MSVLPVWNFEKGKTFDLILKPEKLDFHEFLTEQFSTVGSILADSETLINIAIERYSFTEGMAGIASYLNDILHPELKDIFTNVSTRLYVDLELINEIDKTLTKYIYADEPNKGGLNQCVALFLKGLLEYSFYNGSEYLFRGMFYISGAILPFFKGQIPEFSETAFGNEQDYKERVLFSVLMNKYVQYIRRSTIAAKTFSVGYLTELDNVLNKSTDFLGVNGAEKLRFNSMRLIMRRDRVQDALSYLNEFVTFNPRYTIAKKTLEELGKEYSSVDIEKEFDKTFTRLISGIILNDLLYCGTGLSNQEDTQTELVIMVVKDYQFIASLLSKYCPEKQIESVNEYLINTVYTILRDILLNLANNYKTLNSIEIPIFELSKYIEQLAKTTYGEENRYMHVFFCINEIAKHSVSVNQNIDQKTYLYWHTPALINSSLVARETFTKASDLGSTSARVCLKLAYTNSHTNKTEKLKLSAKMDMDSIEKGYPLGVMGINYDLTDIWKNITVPGIENEKVKSHIVEKLLKFEMYLPDLVGLYLPTLKSEVAQKNPEIDECNVEGIPESLHKWHQFLLTKFPFLVNQLYSYKGMDEELSLYCMCADLGAKDIIFKISDTEKQELYLNYFDQFTATLSDLTNKDTIPYYLHTDNWYRFKYPCLNGNELVPLKLAQKIESSILREFEVYNQYENFLAEKLKSGELPSSEEVGVAINFITHLMYISEFTITSEKVIDRQLFKKLSDHIFEFWVSHSSSDFRYMNVKKLSDMYFSRGNNLLLKLNKCTSESKGRADRENILVSPTIALRFIDTIIEFSPSYDSVMGVVYSLYLQISHNVLNEAIRKDNHVDSAICKLYTTWLYSLIFVNSACYYGVEYHIESNKLSKKDVQANAAKIEQQDLYIQSTRRMLANIDSINHCVSELENLIFRGSIYASEIYHGIANSSFIGKSEFMPVTSVALLKVAENLSQKFTVESISLGGRSIILPYLSLLLFMYQEEENPEQPVGFITDEKLRLLLLNELVKNNDIYGLIYDAHIASCSPNKVSATGAELAVCIDRIKNVALYHKTEIQLLNSASDDYVIKFPQAKQKYKLSEIDSKEWLFLFIASNDILKAL